MTYSVSFIPPGFGKRLREERLRLKIKQEKLGEIGGVGRVTQFEYEREARSPNVKYLSAIASSGVDLGYLLFAQGKGKSSLKSEQMGAIEKQALKMLVSNEKEMGTQMNDDKRYELFELIRSELVAKKLQDALAE